MGVCVCVCVCVGGGVDVWVCVHVYACVYVCMRACADSVNNLSYRLQPSQSLCAQGHCYIIEKWAV